MTAPRETAAAVGEVGDADVERFYRAGYYARGAVRLDHDYVRRVKAGIAADRAALLAQRAADAGDAARFAMIRAGRVWQDSEGWWRVARPDGDPYPEEWAHAEKACDVAITRASASAVLAPAATEVE